jgi:hypothetical protein
MLSDKTNYLGMNNFINDWLKVWEDKNLWLKDLSYEMYTLHCAKKSNELLNIFLFGQQENM